MMLLAALGLSFVIALMIFGVGIALINDVATQPTEAGHAAFGSVLLLLMALPVALAAADLGDNAVVWGSAVWLSVWSLVLSGRSITRIGKTPKTVSKRAGVILAVLNFSYVLAVSTTIGYVAS